MGVFLSWLGCVWGAGAVLARCQWMGERRRKAAAGCRRGRKRAKGELRKERLGSAKTYSSVQDERLFSSAFGFTLGCARLTDFAQSGPFQHVPKTAESSASAFACPPSMSSGAVANKVDASCVFTFLA